VVEINTETLTTPEARDLTIETRKVVHAECHKAEFVVAKATLTERRACVKDFNEGIPKGANERAAFYASL
jgi:hypothetical protein